MRFFVNFVVAITLSFSPKWNVFASAAQEVDLSSQFLQEIPLQKGGDYACHTYATAALIEAKCFRKLGKHIDISESLLLYGNYIDQIEHLPPEELDYISFSRSTRVPFLREEAPRFLGAYRDSGSTIQDLTRALSGWVCEEGQFITLDELERVASLWRFTWKILNWNPTDLENPKPPVAALFDRMIKGEFGFAYDIAESVGWGQMSPDLEKCFEGESVQSRAFDRSLALQLLDEGIPFVCSAAADFFEDRRTGKKELVFDPKSTGHATIVLGYRHVKAKNHSHIEWKVRDSVVGEVVPAQGDCLTMTYIR